MNMRDQIRELEDRFDERSMAEKLLISILLVAVLLWAFSSFYSSPVSTEVAALERNLNNTRLQLLSMQQREQQAQNASIQDPNLAARQRIERAIGEQAELQGEIEQLAGNLVTPQTMTRSLTSILESQSGLELVRVENRRPQAMRETAASNAAEGETVQQVYKHSLVLELEGDYLSLISYLQRIESFPERFFWDQINFVQTAWPNARITLELHTLSTEEGFVGV